MAICHHFAPNGEKSLLYQQLEQKYGADQAHDVWTAIRSQQFLNKEGDWIGDSENITIPLDDNSEPILDFIRSSESLKGLLDFLDGYVPQDVVSRTVEQPESTGVSSQADIDAALAKPSIPQKYKDKGVSVQGTEMHTRVPGRTSGEMIRNGERTETTRSGNQFSKPSIGTLEIHEDQKGKMLVRVTTEPYKPNKADFDAYEGWADEQWERSQHHFTDKWFSYRFEYIGDVVGGKLVPKNIIPEVNEVPKPVPVIPVSTFQYKVTKEVNFEPDEKGERIDEQEMLDKIRVMYAGAKANPTTRYSVTYTYINDKIVLNSKYKLREMADLFDYAGEIPVNVTFTPSFLGLIQNSSRRIIEQMGKERTVEFMGRDEVGLQQARLTMSLPKIGMNGQAPQIGDPYFAPQQHQELIETVMMVLHKNLVKDPNMHPAKAMWTAFAEIDNFRHRTDAPEHVKQNLIYLYNVRERIANDVLDHMGIYKWSISEKGRKEVVEAIRTLQPLTEEQSRIMQEGSALQSLEDDFSNMSDELFEQSTGEIIKNFSDESIHIDPKDTASARLKMDIGTQPEVDNDLKPAKNFIGFQKLLDFEATFEDMLAELANRAPNYQAYLAALQASTKPNLRYYAQHLEKGDTQKKNEFVKVMTKQYQNFSMAIFEKESKVFVKNGITTTRTDYTLKLINANQYSQQDVLRKEWMEQRKLSPMMITNAAGQRVPDVAKVIKEWLPILDSVQPERDLVTNKPILFDWSNEGKVAPIRKAITDMFIASGMTNWTQAMTDYMFRNMETLTKGMKGYKGGLAHQFSFNSDREPMGVFSAFILEAAGMNTMIDASTDEETLQARATNHNPLEHQVTKLFARVAVKFIPRTFSGSHRSSEGKVVWDYGLNTKLSHWFRNFTTNFNELVSQLTTKNNVVDITRKNWLLETLAAKPVLLENMRLDYLDGLKPNWGKNRGVTRSAASDREQHLTSIAFFQNQGNSGGRSGTPVVNYLSVTHADKGMTPLFMNVPKLVLEHPDRIGFKEDGTPRVVNNLIGKTDSPLYNIFHAEHKRIVNQKNIDFNNKQYNKGKNLFYFMPDFNYDNMKAMVDEDILTQTEFQQIWLAGERNLVPHINDDKQLKVINKILTRLALGLTQSTIDNWIRTGIVTEDSNMFDQRYVKEIINKQLGGKATRDGILRAAAQDYAINHFIFYTSLSQIAFGDPALTYKVKEEDENKWTDQQKVDSTMNEYAKRLAKDIAPGADMNWNENEKTYTTITLADVVSKDDYVPEKLRKAYSKIEGTDAQEFTTVREHLRILFAQGMVPEKVFNEMMKIIDDAGPGGYYEFKIKEHRDIILQPMKPVYSGQRRVPQNRAIMEDYIKSSSYPLYPPLVSGSAMDKVRILMEKGLDGTGKTPIDRANFASAKKVGNPNQPARVLNEDGTFNESIDPNEIAGAIQVLDRSGFRIQQDVPYDETKDAIKIVSQANKLLTEGIENIEGFEVPGHEPISGKRLRSLKESIRIKMINQNLTKFLSTLGLSEQQFTDLKQGGKLNQKQKDKIYAILQQEAKKKGYTLNEQQGVTIRTKDGDPVIPLWLNPAANKFESRLISIIKKIVEIKMPGKSYVQASSAGYTFRGHKTKFGLDGVDKGELIHTSNWDGNPLKTMREGPDGKILPAQVIAPFNFTDNDGNDYDIKDFLIEGTNRLDMIRVPQALLQLFGARIPNQGHNSMLAMEIVAFVPKEMGDIVIVPAAITKQMGADFDVDKLYTYKRPYFTNEDGTLEQYPADDETEGLQTQYFDLHWAVLTHPEMLEKILRPLDKPDLEDENKLLAPKKSGFRNWFDVQSQLQDFQSGKDAKTLVGSTSLSVTFNAVIQNKDLYIYHEEMSDTGVSKVRDYIQLGGLALTDLSGYGTSEYKSELRTKADNLTTIQSGALDNAKNRSLDNLNLNSFTYRAAAALLQLEDKDGKALDLRYVTRLLTQPIIREYATMMRTGNDSLSEAFEKNLKLKVIDQLESKYIGIPIEIDATADDLLKIQKMDPTDPEFNAYQRYALNLFTQLDAIGTRMSELQGLVNNDTGGAGPNLLYSLDKAKKMSTIEQAPIANARQLLYHDGEVTEQSVTFDATVGVANAIITQLFPYDKFDDSIFEMVKKTANRNRLTIDQQRKILSGLASYIYTKGGHWWQDAQAERIRLLYGKNSLAKRLVEARRTVWGKDNVLVRPGVLSVKIGDTSTSPDYIEFQAASSGTAMQKLYETSWLQLMTSSDPVKRHLGEDLLRYTYLSSGNQDATSFVKFAPVAYLANTEFSNSLRNIHEWLTDNPDHEDIIKSFSGFIGQYFQHNPDFAVQVSKELFGPQPDGQEYPETIFVPDRDNPAFGERGFGNLSTGQDMVPMVSFKSNVSGAWVLYHKRIDEYGIQYVRIDTLGNKYTDEYDGESPSAHRSIFPENRAMLQQLPSTAEQDIFNTKNESYSRYQLTQSSLEQIGITETGGKNAINRSLVTIMSDSTQPEHLRTVARVLKTIAPGIEVTDAFQLSQQTMETRLIIDPSIESGGVYSTGSLRINPYKLRNKVHAAEVFLHELEHERLARLIGAAGFDTRIYDIANEKGGKYKEIYLATIREFSEKYPDVIKHLETLETIRYEAYNHLQNNPNEANNQLLNYAFGTLQEFVAHVRINTEVAGYLNNIQSKRGETLLSRIWNLLSELLESFAKSLGMKVKEGSLLKEALAHTLKLSTLEVSRDIQITNALQTGATLVVPTEAQAMEVQQLAEEVYGRKTEVSTNMFDFMVNITNQAKVFIDPQTKIGKVIGELNVQKKELERAINTAGTKEDQLLAKVRLSDLQKDIDKLVREKNLNLISVVGKKQIAWVDKVLKNSNPSITDTLMAIKIADMWSNINELIRDKLSDGEENDIELITLQAEAKDRRIKLNVAAQKTVDIAFAGYYKMEEKDYGIDLKDPSYPQAALRSLNTVQSKLIQGVGILGRTPAADRDEEMTRVQKRVQAWAKKMKDYGVRTEDLLQKNSWGLINRISGDWGAKLRDLNKELHEKIDFANKSFGQQENKAEGEKIRSKYINDAWKEYWKEVKKDAAFVDTRIFFNWENGGKLTGTKIDKALADLAKEVGDMDYAKELVDEAQEKLKVYIQERTSYADSLAALELTEEEKDGKTKVEQDALLLAKKKQIHDEWINENSPNKFFEGMSNEKETSHVNRGRKWSVIVPKASTKYYDTRYKDMYGIGTGNDGNKKLQEVYEKLKAIIQDHVGYLPESEQERLDENFLPIIAKDIPLTMAGLLNSLYNWDKKLVEMFTATEAEEYSRNKPNEIPIRFTESTRKTREISDRSTDIPKIVEMFTTMAIHYKHMSKILPVIDVAESIVKQAAKEKELNNALKSMAYFKDMVIFKKPHLLEAKAPNATYDLTEQELKEAQGNPAKTEKVKLRIKTLMQRRKLLQKEMEDSGDFDSIQDKIKEIDKINEELTYYEKHAKYAYGSKVGDVLISANQLISLGFQPFSALGNLTFGLASVHIHAHDRRDFEPKDVRWAMAELSGSVVKYSTFGGVNTTKARKISNLMERYGIMGDTVDTEYGKNKSNPKNKSFLAKLFNPFNWQKGGDYYAKAITLLAMMKKRTVMVTVDGTQQEIPLYEAMNEEGVWDSAKYGEAPEWYNEDVNKISEQTEHRKFRDKVKMVMMIVFGNQDKNAPMEGKAHIGWRLAGQFRMSWFTEGVATRWAPERESGELGRTVKGRYLSYFDLGWSQFFMVTARQTLSALPFTKVDIFKGITDKEGNQISETDMGNIRKNFAELAYVVGITAAIFAIGGIFGDDDRRGKKKEAAAKARRFILNMLIRNYQDLMLYANPGVVDQISGNLLPATAVIGNAIKAMKAVENHLFNPDDVEAGDKAKRAILRTFPIVNLIPKAEYMTKRNLGDVQ